MARLILKHAIDKSFLKYGFFICKEDLERERALITSLHINGVKVGVRLDGNVYEANVDHPRGDLYRFMFKTQTKDAFQSKYASLYTTDESGDISIIPGSKVLIGFYDTETDNIWEVREIVGATGEDSVDPKEMRRLYQEYLNSLNGGFSGYVNAIDKDFVKDTVKKMYGKSSAYQMVDSEDVLSLVDEIRSNPDLDACDKRASSRCPSCSLKKYAEFLLTLKPCTTSMTFEIDKIIKGISDSGLIFDPSFIQRYVCALLTKPFVILSGLTGSGKTQLAMALPKLLCKDKSQYKIIPVGADWTNRENLLGYQNALIPGRYEAPDALKLIIEAAKEENQDKPYFLVLDEMNMSYVERYFADFLSAMESREAIPLWDVENDDVPKMIELPKNLFIVGTINVDETTYMFSPKVLDRANVIEFRINKTQMSEYLSGPCELKELVKMPECAADFVRIATGSKTQDALSGEIKKTLVSMFEALSLIQKEFGYRTASEMSRYIGLAKSYAGMSDNDAVDSAIVQKLLPKVHGSRKKVAPILKSLWMACYSGEASEIDSIEYMPSLDLFKYPLTAEKVWRMYSTAQDNGFTSFAEA